MRKYINLRKNTIFAAMIINELGLIVFLCALAYMLGSIPSGVWFGKSMHGIDIRDYGSGNAGATNTFRVLGKEIGILVLLLDVIKGLTAASLILFLDGIPHGTERYVNLQLLFGLLAVIGHIFPLFANFKGGKGIATLLGMVIGIHWVMAIACIALFLIVLSVTKYVSLSSILATLAFPFFTVFWFQRDEPLLIAFGIAASLLVVLTHKKNISKLIKGQENKTYLVKKRVQ